MKPERRKLFKKHITAERLLAHVDLDAAIDAPENADKTPEEIADAIIDTIAAATPWSVIIPGIGVLIDAVEAAVIKAIVHGIIFATAKKKREKAAATAAATQTSAATTSAAPAATPPAAAAGAGAAPPPGGAQPGPGCR